MPAQLTVLLIEDDDVDREAVHRLVGDDFHLLDAETGKQGLAVFRSQQPDCVLLDYRLPDIDGLDVLDKLVEEQTPVVMLTGRGTAEIAVEAMKRGAQDYLSKDAISQEALIRAVANAVEKVALQRKLQTKQKELQQFANIVAHDLQEPLRGVDGLCKLLQQKYRGKQLDSQADEYMDLIVDGTKRMQTLIDDLLDYSRVDREDQRLQPVDCVPVFDQAINNLRAAIEESQATVSHDGLPTVTANGSQLVQLFQNLIGNAVKYRGDATPEIHVMAESKPDEVLFSVRDNGIGIDPKYSERVFQIFRRLHGRDEYSGTGIGLAICKKIVELHDGRIWVESQPGQGSTFLFTIPTKNL